MDNVQTVVALVLGTLEIIALMSVWTDHATIERKLIWTMAV